MSPVKIELLPALEGSAYNRLLIDGAEQEASAVYFDLTVGRETMTAWRKDGDSPAEARRFFERKQTEHGSGGR